MANASWGRDDTARRFADHLNFHAPLVDMIIEAAVRPGDSVLDVGCGTGLATRAAAIAAGETGRVVGTDVSADMLDVAASISTEAGCPIDLHLAPAEAQPFADDDFDAVLCSQSVQFFPDAAAGLAEMKRVARPGGRVAITVWTARADSPFFEAQFEMLVRWCGVDPSGPATPFTRDAARVHGWFADAGFESIDLQSVSTVASLPPVREFSPVHLSAIPWGSAFFELDNTARDDALSFVENELSGYATETGIEVPFSSFVATAAA
jgi:ubiquinone/menaquinone biosynthesis C-methylase UbiE